jgi:hypothetical protein
MDPARFPHAPHPLAPHAQKTRARIDPVMERRTFMAMLAGGSVVAPFAAEAQPAAKIARIGWLGENRPLTPTCERPSAKDCVTSVTSRVATS